MSKLSKKVRATIEEYNGPLKTPADTAYRLALEVEALEDEVGTLREEKYKPFHTNEAYRMAADVAAKSRDAAVEKLAQLDSALRVIRQIAAAEYRNEMNGPTRSTFEGIATRAHEALKQ